MTMQGGVWLSPAARLRRTTCPHAFLCASSSTFPTTPKPCRTCHAGGQLRKSGKLKLRSATTSERRATQEFSSNPVSSNSTAAWFARVRVLRFWDLERSFNHSAARTLQWHLPATASSRQDADRCGRHAFGWLQLHERRSEHDHHAFGPDDCVWLDVGSHLECGRQRKPRAQPCAL